MCADHRPLARNGILIASVAAGFALLVYILVRRPDAGWQEFVWFAAFAATFVIRVPHAARARKGAVVEARKDIQERTLLSGMFLTMMLLPLIHLATGLFSVADYDLPAWVRGIGAVAQIPYLWLFHRSHADLGLNWSPGLEVRQDHRLVTAGIYARIRHPMYASIWITALAQPLLIHNWVAGGLVVPAFAAMWFLRVPREEALMRDRFGAEYDAYTARAGRLWPKFGR